MRNYKGLGKILKWEFVCFVIVLISLTGLPPTAGFISKLLIFSATFQLYSSAGSVWILLLLITGAITTVVSLFYYLKIPLFAYLREADNTAEVRSERNSLMYIIVFLTFLLLLFGLFPDVFS